MAAEKASHSVLFIVKTSVDLAIGKILNPPSSSKRPSSRVTDGLEIDPGFERLDIGPKTIALYKEALANAKIVFWNGPMGVFEDAWFAKGTMAICDILTNLDGAFTVIGGGDSASAAAQFGYKEKFSHVSTGGGASLELIENDGHLPGIDIIADK